MEGSREALRIAAAAHLLPLLALLAGCAGVTPDGGFDTVARQAQ